MRVMVQDALTARASELKARATKLLSEHRSPQVHSIRLEKTIKIRHKMGWIWGDSGSSTDKLDPSLQDFLKKEAPTGQRPSLPTPPKAQPAAEPAKRNTTSEQTQTDPAQPNVPPQSQFQDGRYAHLWKNYTPQHILDDRGKSEQDRLRDLVDVYNDRRGDVGRVAMENCALEYMEQYECFRNPKDWWSRGTLCNAESRRFNRCYDLQSKFLKALGYLTMDVRSQEEDEKIQMHADKLYQQLLVQEAEIEKAEKEGKPKPQFESLMSRATASRAAAADRSGQISPQEEEAIWSGYKPELRQDYEKKLLEMEPEKRDIERLAMLGELKAQTGVSKKVEETFVEERIARMKRREAGQATIGDTLKYWWGWG